MKKLLIQGWSLEKDVDGYHIASTHYAYITEIVKYYSVVGFLSPVKHLPPGAKSKLTALKNAGELPVHELPFSNSYASALKSFAAYYEAYKKLSQRYDRIYVRYPTPFGWLSKYFFDDIIIHFVGDPVDAALNNPNFSWLKKRMLISLFIPEHLLYLNACKKAMVFTNGVHLSEKLKISNINAECVISSTLTDDDFFMDEGSIPTAGNLSLLYAGYLRKAKGIETLIRAFHLLLKSFPKAVFTIAGSGESDADLKALVSQLAIGHAVTFTGHIESREELNNLYRSHNIFAFASFSEGSPRVILEAMANGINVVSSPVGSLPTVFEHHKNIVFAQTGNPDDFFEKIIELISDSDNCLVLKKAAFEKVKQFTNARFIKKIFE